MSHELADDPAARAADGADATAITDRSVIAGASPSAEEETDDVGWADGRIVARRVTRLGAIELSSTALDRPDPLLVAGAVREGLRREGLDLLPWSEAARSLRERMDFLHRSLGEPWPDVSTDALTATVETWLGPDLAKVRGSRDLRRIDVLGALRRLLPWPAAGRLDELAPERVTVPSGSQVRVDYTEEQPVLAVRLQEVFGWTATPRVADGRVPLLLHLLSPARRPAAVTADLASFWTTGYPQVRADLRGRYPKHSWPDDPTTAEALRGTKRRG